MFRIFSKVRLVLRDDDKAFFLMKFLKGFFSLRHLEQAYGKYHDST